MHESRKIGEIAGQSERNGRRKSLLEECTATVQEKLRRRTMSKKEDERAERKAKKDLKEGKSPKTASGEFVHEEMEHYKEGKHGKSRKQAIAIGISKARRHGIPYPGRGNSNRSSGKSSSRSGSQEKTKAELYEKAKRLDIEGRSKMDKEELASAVKKAS
jgi:uncharacterized protein DUF6496/Rho termination factor-like protein